MKKIGILLVVLGFSTLMMAAENKISGQVLDSEQQPIAYATVSLLTSDSALITGTITNENGEFSITAPASARIVQVSFVGYETYTNALNISEKNLKITLNEEATALAEVEVSGKRPLIERQFDKIVLNVASSPFSTGFSSKELLKKAPGVNVDKDGNVTVNGKSVSIYIDGRPSDLSGDQLKAMLEGTDGSTIEKIEVITNPSAKYDAAGQGGIINIKTRRNMMKGLNGSLAAAYGGMYWKDISRWQNQEMFSLNLNYRTEKTYTFGSIVQFYNNQSDRSDSRNISRDSLGNSIERYDRADNGNTFQYYLLKVGNDWFVDKKNTLGFIFQAPFAIFKQETLPNLGYGYTKINDIETETSENSGFYSLYMPQHSINLNYTHVFNDSLEREITANLDYKRNRTDSENRQTARNRFAERTDSITNTMYDVNTKQKVNIYSAKVDFQTNFWRTGMIEAGAKWALSSTNNRMTTDSATNDIASPTQNSDFDYSEHVAALYISVAKQFGEHFNAKLGLRGEYTHSLGRWISSDSTTKRDYFDLFPTAFVGYNPTQDWSMDMSYTRRIVRPHYRLLNPFRTYSDAHNYTEGNPDLKPSYTHQVNINFGYSQYVSLGFDFSHTVDDYAQQPEIMPNGNKRVTFVNFGTYTQHGVNLSLTELPIVPKFKTAADGTRTLDGSWLSLTVYAGYQYIINKSYDKTVNLRQHCGYGSATLTASLPKDWTIAVDGMYSAPTISGYYRSSDSYYLGASIRKMWKEKGLIFTLDAQDLLRSMKDKNTAKNLPEGYSSVSSWIGRYQHVSVSVTWMFGQQQYVKQRKVGTIDEDSRMSSGK